jgi:hypothetical protein
MHLDKSAGDIKGKDIWAVPKPGAPPFALFERWDSAAMSL